MVLVLAPGHLGRIESEREPWAGRTGSKSVDINENAPSN